MNDKDPFVFCFALDNDVSLRSILGLPTLLAMSVAIDLFSSLLSCVEINHKFLLELHPHGKGLLDGASSNNYLPTIHPSVSTNITFNNSMCSSLHSDNILVTYHFFKILFTGASICFLRIFFGFSLATNISQRPLLINPSYFLHWFIYSWPYYPCHHHFTKKLATKS